METEQFQAWEALAGQREVQDRPGWGRPFPEELRGKLGCLYFTQKICFNNINKFPHVSFNWVGLNGSQLLSHIPPVHTYTADGTVADVRNL
ncbi:hypothetical protein N7533_010396 [Penicillium manginii]|uniref:uncharacterized protein n=1 Tax=Penicillium manginii TaxID=203109 RepID=UPI0025481789|nr:uncharacterized protein N7533_010396 [Penicillium manginii]KAJ5743294.1 hypothetical protein N7533_010396 [Penicillium manginii]